MKKILPLIAMALLTLAPARSAELPSAPKPKQEIVKFSASTVFFGGSAIFQVLAQHHGAQLCKIEDLRAGEINYFGTTDGSGHRPDNADRREAYITGGIYAAALVLELTGHTTAAKRILIFGGTANYGIAGATYWAGCN